MLVDSEIWWDEIRAEFAARHGRKWTLEDRAAVMGANSSAWARIMRERLDLPMGEHEIERTIVDAMVERYRREGAPVIDGAVDAVRRIAAELPVALASSAHPAVIDAALEATGLTDVFTGGGLIGRGGPRQTRTGRLSRSRAPPRRRPADCLVVEDSLNGVRAAKAAGMTVVLVPNTSIPPGPGARELADLVLPRLADLDPLALPMAASRSTERPGAPEA